MRRAILILFQGLWLAASLAPAEAQPAPDAASALFGSQCFATSPSAPPSDASGLRAAIGAHLGNAAPAMKLSDPRQAPRAATAITLTANRPQSQAYGWQSAWKETFFAAILLPAGTATDIDAAVFTMVAPPNAGAEATELNIEASLSPGWLPSRWDVVVFACHDGGIRAYGRGQLYLSSLRLSALSALAAVAALYLTLAAVVIGMQRRQYAFAKAQADRGGVRLSPWAFALRPPVIMQDSFGYCSMSRFQVLLFTVVLTGIYVYVLVRTGSLPTPSADVLALLGITLAGGALARAADAPTIETPNRIWLFGTGILDPTPRLPLWRDLLAGEGELDVSRVQALVFTLLTAGALIANGTSDLTNFTVPKELTYLLGISQAAYVAGKALPRAEATRLNGEVRALREAEAKLMANPGDSAAQLDFATARNALGSVLFDVFGDRFVDKVLRELTPGARIAPAQPPPAA
jgi:hypothetical protein